MNAVEKLEAAIAKLEAQAHEASDGPWQAHIERREYETSAELFDANGGYVIPDGYVADVGLIETLHRTIEPQLAILREARDLFRERLALRAEMSEGWRAKHHPNPDHLWPADIQPLAIADAILGAPDADVG